MNHVSHDALNNLVSVWFDPIVENVSNHVIAIGLGRQVVCIFDDLINQVLDVFVGKLF